MPTTYSIINNVVVNKLTKQEYDDLVTAGVITPDMIENQVWIFSDDNFLSAENLAKLNAFIPADYYKKTEVNDLIAAINALSFEIVSALPTENIDTKKIYLAPKTDSETGNAYDEYAYINGAWERIGSTEIDLSGYYTKTEADNKFLSEKPVYQYSEIQNPPTIPTAETRIWTTTE